MASVEELAAVCDTVRAGDFMAPEIALAFWVTLPSADVAASAVPIDARQVAAPQGIPHRRSLRSAELQAQCHLLRDIVGNPFRPLLPINPSLLTWNGGLIRALAQAAYDDRLLPSGQLDPARLGVLADALDDAGCTDAELLEHLRGEGPHCRGCFAIDLLLGQE
jgi:hypothetical protein